MAGNDDILLRIGADVSDLKRELASARREIKDSGGVVEELQGKLLKMASVAAIGAGLAKLASDALQFADAVQKAADQTGMTAESVQFLRFAAEQTGGSVDGLTSLISKMQRQLVEASDGNKKVAESFADLGLNVGALRDMKPEEQFAAISQAIAAIEDPADRAAAATDAFGKAGADALPTILAFANEQEKIANQFEMIGGPVSADAIKAVDDLGDAGATAGLAVKSLVTELLAAIAPAIINGLSTVSSILGGIRVLVGEGGNEIVDLGYKIRDAESALRSFDKNNPFPDMFGQKIRADMQATLDELMKQEQILLQIGTEGSKLAVKKKAESAEELADLVVVDEARTAQLEKERARLESEANMSEAHRLAEEGAEAAHLQRMIDMSTEMQDTQVELEARELDDSALYHAQTWQQKTANVAGELANMTAGVARENRAMFEINRAAGIASAVVNTAQGVTKALSAYPPPLSFAMAAAQAAAGAAQISAIARTKFGGATAPSQATTPPTPTAPQGGGGGGGGGQASVMRVEGMNPDSLVSGRMVRTITERIVEHVRDGGRVEWGQ